MPVLGIGGLFFRARDPDALNAWYREHLGVGTGCDSTGTGDPAEWCWTTEGGPVVFAPFKADTDYFAADKAFMINLRVSGIDALLDSLRAVGIDIVTKPEWDDPQIGRFARIHDPEGNAIELWEPPDRLIGIRRLTLRTTSGSDTALCLRARIRSRAAGASPALARARLSFR